MEEIEQCVKLDLIELFLFYTVQSPKRTKRNPEGNQPSISNFAVFDLFLNLTDKYNCFVMSKK